MSKSLPVLDLAGPAGCCPPLSAEPLSQMQAEQVAPLLKALAEPVRLRLMSLIASHPGGESARTTRVSFMARKGTTADRPAGAPGLRPRRERLGPGPRFCGGTDS
jgi:DNA-binding transcriptional ArsR family regulator